MTTVKGTPRTVAEGTRLTTWRLADSGQFTLQVSRFSAVGHDTLSSPSAHSIAGSLSGKDTHANTISFNEQLAIRSGIYRRNQHSQYQHLILHHNKKWTLSRNHPLLTAAPMAKETTTRARTGAFSQWVYPTALWVFGGLLMRCCRTWQQMPWAGNRINLRISQASEVSRAPSSAVKVPMVEEATGMGEVGSQANLSAACSVEASRRTNKQATEVRLLVGMARVG